MSTELVEFIQAGGVRNTHFFNGRVLTADDLRAEQKAHRQQRRQLGQALGEGVVYGLEVRLAGASTAARPILSVTKGLAINRNGEAVALTEDVNVALVREEQAQAVEAGLFAECVPPQPLQSQPDFGFYVFTARPISRFEGRAVMVGLENNGIGAGCGSRYAVEGVKFLLIPLALNTGAGASALRAELVNLAAQLDLQTAQLPHVTGAQAAQLQAEIRANTSKLRNGVAHLCFGTEKLAGFTANPFARAAGKSPVTEYGALDELRAEGALTNCDIPLALLYWTNTGVQFVDLWSVRRRLIDPATTDRWNVVAGRRRLNETEAMLLQFQDQVEDLRASDPNLELASAMDYFSHLPPAGLLPLRRGIIPGFNANNFFVGQAHRDPEFIDGALVHALLREAVQHEPIVLAKGEMIWLYKVWQHEKAAAEGVAAQPYVVFANAHIPYLATARFDVARWDYSNYARCENCEI